MQSLFPLRFLTLTLSAPPLTVPKDVEAGTSDWIVVKDRSEYGDFVITSVVELAHLFDFYIDRVVEAPQCLTQSRLLLVAAS